MFDIKDMKKRYFEVNINGQLFEVEPPKVKTLKKIVALQKRAEAEALDDLVEAVRTILAKNKDGKPVSSELIEELDLDQLNGILTQYFEWMAGVKKDPNL